MKILTLSAAFVVTLACPVLVAQPQKATSKTTVTKALPPFSGTWMLNPKRSKLARPIEGESKAVIQYDGKSWHYIHSHQENINAEPEAWQVTMPVNSPKLHVEPGEEITFRSRIRQQGNAMLLEEWGTTGHGQKIHNTVRYTLEDNNNTLVQTEVSVGPLGPVRNVYVLERVDETGARVK
ncbi:hypothetical protein [Terriglobus tenax]|uniref:hypothetical protein n=1 Tax=Terriglobus tenax TaxID=1111115 RepID=UPI0021E00143|nr:hypothetical protein [Terriglobus tenax]